MNSDRQYTHYIVSLLTRLSFLLLSTPKRRLPLGGAPLGCVLVFSLFTLAGAQPLFSAGLSVDPTQVVGINLNGPDISDDYVKWNLDQGEWDHYRQLMQGEAGLYYRHLHPAWVLGIYAVDASVRRHYAERAVKIERRRLDQLLEFNRTYRDVEADYYSGEEVIDDYLFDQKLQERERALEYRGQWKNSGYRFSSTPHRGHGLGHRLGQGDQQNAKNHVPPEPRDTLFISIEDCDRCDAVARERIAAVLNPTGSTEAGLDIFFVANDLQADEITDQAIRQWAREFGIPVEAVRQRKITLNHDQGEYRKLGRPSLPVMKNSNGK